MYEIFEHTADLGIRVRSGNLDDLFADAARGLFSLLVNNLDPASTTSGVTFQLLADNIEDLLHDWLTELLFTFYAGRLVLTDFQVHVKSSATRELTAAVQSEPLDPKRHQIETEVKAITWHALKVEQQPEGWIAEVIVDI
jgi:SHS2 domain-containing protein